jgi:hypothetical protein|nr:MAG TPA: hypothetical protein [Caudoviricetes sp.]
MSVYDLGLESGLVTDRVDTLVSTIKNRLEKYPYSNQNIKDIVDKISTNIKLLDKQPAKQEAYKLQVYDYLNNLDYKLRRLVA